jgi:opacity protein-like surface antigen
MKNKILFYILIICSGCAAIDTSLAGQESFYLQGNVGLLPGHDLSYQGRKTAKKNLMLASASLGYHVLDNCSVGLEMNFLPGNKYKMQNDPLDKTNLSTFKTKATNIIANVNLELVDLSIFRIFIGAGAGAGQIKSKVFNQAKLAKKTNFVYVARAGIAREIAPSFHLLLNVDYHNFNSALEDVVYGLKSKRGLIYSAGLRYDFL